MISKLSEINFSTFELDSCFAMLLNDLLRDTGSTALFWPLLRAIKFSSDPMMCVSCSMCFLWVYVVSVEGKVGMLLFDY
jgi:hypothetical protein